MESPTTETLQASQNMPADVLDGDDSKDSLQEIPIEQIKIQPGFNPRQYFNENEMQELVEDVQLRGIIQPILIRPSDNDNHYWLVAGERRFRAAKQAGLLTIPAYIKAMTDVEAKSNALAENALRASVTPIEEAHIAHQMLSLFNADQKEVCLALGWTQKKLKNRILLLNCSEKVQSALIKRNHITLQHCEVLAGLPVEIQDENIEGIIEKRISVDDMKKAFNSIKCNLSAAIFDNTVCYQGCQFCSNLQASFFESESEKDLCSNRACYQEKTQQALEEKKQSLESQYNVVFFDYEKTDADRMAITQEAMGQEQFAQCQQCQSFGVVLSSQAGFEGEVTTEQCFNLSCYMRIQAKVVTAKSIQSEVKDTKKSVLNKNNSPTSQKTTVAASPTKVIEHTDGFVRKLAAQSLVEQLNPSLIQCFALYALLKQLPGGHEKTILGKHYSNLKGLSEAKFLHQTVTLSDDELELMTQQAIQTHLQVNKDAKINPKVKHAVTNTACAVIEILDVPIHQAFVLDKAFLMAHTKKGIDGILKEMQCNEVSFVDFYNNRYKDQGESYAKLLAKDKDSLISAVLNSGYDFSGFVPQSVLEFIKK